VEAKTKYLLLLFIAGGVIFFFNIGGRDLCEPDETRYAVVAHEIRESGNWFLSHLNGAIYAEKPPLFFWLVNFFTFVLGEDNELAFRLPSALAGLLAMVMKRRDLLRLEKEAAVQINPIEQVKIANRDIVLISNR